MIRSSRPFLLGLTSLACGCTGDAFQGVWQLYDSTLDSVGVRTAMAAAGQDCSGEPDVIGVAQTLLMTLVVSGSAAQLDADIHSWVVSQTYPDGRPCQVESDQVTKDTYFDDDVAYGPRSARLALMSEEGVEQEFPEDWVEFEWLCSPVAEGDIACLDRGSVAVQAMHFRRLRAE